MHGASRPKTLIDLAARAAVLKRRHVGCAALVVLAVLALFCVAFHAGRREVRVATFNIENFPRHERQVRGAFETIETLDVSVVGVQEITDPERFATEARRRLGDDWRFVRDGGRQLQHVGVLYDRSVYRFAWARTHDETQIDGRHKPALEVRLQPRGGGRAVRIIVLHLKSGGDHAATRREQLRRLEPVLADAVESWDELVILGDFNATGDADRANLRALSDRLGLAWATEGLRCTAYWNRRDGCRGSQLDHVLTREMPDEVVARGPCETIGCEPGDRCPAFHREVSDHCPVTARW